MISFFFKKTFSTATLLNLHYMKFSLQKLPNKPISSKINFSCNQDIRNVKQDLKKLKEQKNNLSKLQLHLKLAQNFNKLNMKEDRLEHINKALKIDPTDFKAQIKLIECQIMNNQFQKTLDSILELKKKYSTQLQLSQINSLDILRTKKLIALKKGYEYSQDWIEAFQKNSLQFDFISPFVQIRKCSSGFGIFAKNDIKKHKIIVVQRPFLTLTPQQYPLPKTKDEEIKMRAALIQKFIDLSSISFYFQEKYNTLYCKQDANKTIQERKKKRTFNLDNNLDIVIVIKKHLINSFQIGSLLPQLLDQEFKDNGSGLYQFSSFFNHSCKSNIDKDFIGDYIILRTLQDIKKDQQLFISYVKASFIKPNIRQEQLKKRQDPFICECQYCLNNKTDQRWYQQSQKYYKSMKKLIPNESQQNMQIARNKMLQINNLYSLNLSCFLKDQKLRWKILCKIFNCSKDKEQTFKKMFQNKGNKQQSL